MMEENRAKALARKRQREIEEEEEDMLNIDMYSQDNASNKRPNPEVKTAAATKEKIADKPEPEASQKDSMDEFEIDADMIGDWDDDL